jgi:H+/Cl- antiporter ClcA
MATKKDFIRIGVLSLLLSMTGFILDLDERVPDIKTNVFEIVMMTGLCYGIISVFYFTISLLLHKLAKQ